MFNLLRMDLYRIKRCKFVYICLAFLLVTIFLCYGLLFLVGTPEGQELAPKIGMGALVETQAVFTDEENPSEQPESLLDGMDVIDMLRDSFMDGGAYGVVFGIAVALFVCGDFQNGFVKNILSFQRRRWKYIVSKILTMGILNVFYIVICFAVGLLLNVLFHHMVPFSPWKNILFYLLWAWFVTTAFAAFIILVCVFTRSAAASVSTAVLVGSGLILLPLYSLTNLLGAGGWFEYTLYYNISYGPSCYQTTADLKALVIGIVFLLIYGIASVTVLIKQDI